MNLWLFLGVLLSGIVLGIIISVNNDEYDE